MRDDDAQSCDGATLTRLIRTGDEHALEQLTRCLAERLMATGRRHCRSDDEARDAVQEALLVASQHLGDFRGEGSPEGWLVRIVTNTCRQMRRGRKNDAALHDDLSDHVLVSEDGSPEDLAQRGELASKLGEALATLSPEDRAIVLLSDAEGWTAPEIAVEIARTPNAVRLRLSRARRRLRERLETALSAPDTLSDPGASVGWEPPRAGPRSQPTGE